MRKLHPGLHEAVVVLTMSLQHSSGHQSADVLTKEIYWNPVINSHCAPSILQALVQSYLIKGLLQSANYAGQCNCRRWQAADYPSRSHSPHKQSQLTSMYSLTLYFPFGDLTGKPSLSFG